MNSVRKTRLGFTLLEFLVLIGIVALLISSLQPAPNRARASAAANKCKSNLRQLGPAVQMYAQNNQNTLRCRVPHTADVTAPNPYVFCYGAYPSPVSPITRYSIAPQGGFPWQNRKPNFISSLDRPPADGAIYGAERCLFVNSDREGFTAVRHL